MPGRRFALVHVHAEDRQRLLGASQGQAVFGGALFYWPGKAWLKIPPGRLDLTELWGIGSGYGNNDALVSSKRLPQPSVQFYPVRPTAAKPNRNGSYVAINGNIAENFSFTFFGRRHS